jgi:ubiquinone biosynthesis protein COQ4
MRNPLPLLKLIVASAKLVKDTTRLDEVIKLADTLTDPAVVQQMVDAVALDPVGARALLERPRMRVDLTELGCLPVGTLGREFADHMRRAGLDPADLPYRPASDPHSFLRAHLFETHDVWHVVTGFAVDEAGELGLQAFYMAQLPARLAPLLLAVGLTNTFMYAFDDREARMNEIARGWLLGRRAGKLFGTEWSKLWSVPLRQVQASFGLLETGSAASDSKAA